MSYRRYLHGCFAAALFVGLSIAAVNWAVDPSGIFGNSPGGIYISTERPYKMVQVRAYPHKILLVGSSKTAAFDPTTMKEWNIFNASFSGAVPEEMLAFMSQRGQNAEMVLIGLDFRMFLGKLQPEVEIKLGTDSLAAKARHLFNLSVFFDSLQDLYKSVTGQPTLITSSGQWNPLQRDELERALQGAEQGRVPWDLSHRQQRARSFRQEVMQHVQSKLAKHDFATKRLVVLRHMRDLLEKRKQAYRVFIDPQEICILELIAASPRRAIFERFRKEVRTVFPDVLDYSVSSYSNSKYFYRSDPYHYKSETANQLIKDVLNGQPPKPLASETTKCTY